MRDVHDAAHHARTEPRRARARLRNGGATSLAAVSRDGATYGSTKASTYYCYLYKTHHDGRQTRSVTRCAAPTATCITRRMQRRRPIVTDFLQPQGRRSTTPTCTSRARASCTCCVTSSAIRYGAVIHQYGTKFRFAVRGDRGTWMRVVRTSTARTWTGCSSEIGFFWPDHPDFKGDRKLGWRRAGVLRVNVGDAAEDRRPRVPCFRVPASTSTHHVGSTAMPHHVCRSNSRRKRAISMIPKRPKDGSSLDKDDWILKTLEFAKKTGRIDHHELRHAPYMSRARAEALASKARTTRRCRR